MEEKTVRTWQTGIVDCALTLAGLCATTLGVLAIWKENSGLAATGLTAGLVLLFASTIHRFESLKGLGIEAKTRELNRTIDKAEVTLAQVKKLAELAGANLVKIYSSIGRWDSAPSVIDSYQQSRKVKDLLTEIGSDDQSIRLALTPWARTAAFDLLQFRHQKIHEQVVALQTQLSAAFQAAQPHDKPALQARLEAASNYRLLDMGSIQDWELSSFASRLRDYVSGIPDPVDPDVLSELRSALDKDEAEFKAFDTKQDFADINYWKTLKIR